MSLHSQMTEDTGWSHSQEELLKSWAERSNGYSWLHKRAESYYGKRVNYIAVPTAVLAGLSGSVQFSLINDSSENFYIKLATALTTLSVSLLSILQKSLNYQSKKEQHKKTATDFASLYRDISAELSMPPSERQASKEYVGICRTEMDKLTKVSPTIPDSIIGEFNKNFGNLSVYKPSIACGITEVEIYNKSNKKSEKHYDHRILMQKVFNEWKEKNYEDDKIENSKTENSVVVNIDPEMKNST